MLSRKFLIAGVLTSSLVLTGCWGGQDDQATPTPTPGITQEQLQTLKQELETKTGNQLITPKPELSTNTKEVNLTPQNGILGTGVAVFSQLENQSNYQILADLPELQPNEKYWAWVSDGTTYKRLGQVKASKAGFVFEYSSKDNLSSMSTIAISRETNAVDQPTTIVLQGKFK